MWNALLNLEDVCQKNRAFILLFYPMRSSFYLSRTRLKHPQEIKETALSFIFVSKKKYLFFLFVYLAALGLSCGTWGLQSSLWHMGSLVGAGEHSVMACGIWFPDQGSNSGLLLWDLKGLPTGPPGMSLYLLFVDGSLHKICPTLS